MQPIRSSRLNNPRAADQKDIPNPEQTPSDCIRPQSPGAAGLQEAAETLPGIVTRARSERATPSFGGRNQNPNRGELPCTEATPGGSKAAGLPYMAQSIEWAFEIPVR